VPISMRFVCIAEASQVKSVEVLGHCETDPVTPFQLREFVSMLRGGPVLAGTLRTWRNRIGVRPDSEGLYTVDDLRLLGRYLEALAAGRTTTQFLNQEYGKNA
jgi:hypothetical protein